MEMPRNLRSNMPADDIEDIAGDAHAADQEAARPASIEGDERRMQVRVYNFWAGLLGEAKFPAIEDLQPAEMDDFGPFSVLLDISAGLENPGIAYVGRTLAEECDIAQSIGQLSDVPARSLLSRITDHYMQILANEAPIGFEAEFVNQRAETVLYRGILLPFSSDSETIDFIYGVINWKIVGEAGEDAIASASGRTSQSLALSDEEPSASLSSKSDEKPRPRKKPVIQVDYDDLSPDETLAYGGEQPTGDETAEAVPQEPVKKPTEIVLSADFEAGLADHLAEARELAAEAQSSEDRSRRALYAALGRAHDFVLAAKHAPQELAEILSDAGLKAQQRAPMTPVVKLVFGADYDKKRVTEYAAALAHAERLALPSGAFEEHIAQTDGGLKAIVAAERKARREDRGIAPKAKPKGLDAELASKLGAIAPRTLETLPADDSEFALVMIRRTGDGKVFVLDAIPDDPKLLNQAARKLVDAKKL